MLYVGIDISSKKHDCCIIGEYSEILEPFFTVKNDADGFNSLLNRISRHSHDFCDVKIGLESTGHYSNNIISFLQGKGFQVIVFNPLQVNLYRKARSLRKTKTDKADAKFLAQMLISTDLSPISAANPEITELKALVRHRFRLVSMRTKLKISVSRLVTILFPELPDVLSSIHQASSYALLLELPTACAISKCHLTRLTNLLYHASKHRYGRDKAIEIKSLAARSIGSNSYATGLELQQTLRLINNLRDEISILDSGIKKLMIAIDSPVLSIPGISYTLGSVILAEIGNIDNFQNPNKLLAFAGLEPSTHQSGKFTAGNTPMVKRGSTYLRWALLQAARLASVNDPVFRDYAAKKTAEGKHYFVVMSHVGKKLVRVLFHLLKYNVAYKPLLA